MTVNFSKDKFNLREKLKELERPSVDKLVTKDKNGAYIDTIRGNTKLESISSSVSGTAVDVFVYDTRKDSDGGAWRKRTQNTSWYNETLGTATRGTRKKFPAVAVIVAETSKVTIYDGDDPDLPMWMVFEVGRTPTIRALNWHTSSVNSTISSTFQLNGKLCIGSAGGVTIFDFVSDNIRLSYNVSNWELVFKTISNRNDIGGAFTGGNGYNIVSPTTNDVAMTVLPNAPIDSATGLPVPTIAVATESGTSVIRDDETVADYTGFSPIKKVATDSKYVYVYARSEPNDYIFKSTFLLSDGVYNTNITAGSGGFYVNSIGSPVSPLLKNMNATNTVVAKDHTYIRSGNDGIEILDGNVTTVDADTAVIPIAYITSDYNTGYMVGDIKSAFLSDTNDTNAVGGDIALTSSISGTINAYASTGVLPADLVEGQKYVININVSAYTSGSLALWSSGANYRSLQTTSTGDFNVLYTHTVDGEQLVGADTTGFVGTATVSVTIAELDRSVNNNGLQVYGTVTKSAVATGAELVAYSGFSASNYLTSVQTAIDFGSSPNATICFISWINQSTTGEYSYIMSAQDGNSTAPIGMAVHTSTGNFYVYEGTVVKSSSYDIVDGTWHHCVGIIDGTSILGYVDGKKVIDTTTSNPPNLSGIDRFNVGHFRSGTSNSYHNRGSLALSRITKSIPSPEQIKKIYEDEKYLFQENAKATLYGSSDAVTALGYDEDTELLHVGTSAGRSEFQGLRRINNTTTAVTTAISASNDLVAEQ